MVEMEPVGGVDPCLGYPLLDAVCDGKRRFPVGKGHLVSPLLHLSAQAHHGLGRPGPLPIAEKVEDLQSEAPLPLLGLPCPRVLALTKGDAGRRTGTPF